jgi:hypothetical protein
MNAQDLAAQREAAKLRREAAKVARDAKAAAQGGGLGGGVDAARLQRLAAKEAALADPKPKKAQKPGKDERHQVRCL